MSNITPAVWASGQFKARSPFNVIVDPDTQFTIEAVRTVSEMQQEKIDIYDKLLKPVGISKDETTTWLEELLKAKACIIALTQRSGVNVYVPSTYLETYPMIDGVVFERLCIVVDCGSCSPGTKDRLDSTLEAITYIVQKNLGIENPVIQYGTVPQKSYVTKTQAEAWEESRLLRIDAMANPTIENESLKKQNAELLEYVTYLETQVKEKSV